jgi:hypothetical protein
MRNSIKGGTNISPLLSAIIISGLRLTADKKLTIKSASYNSATKLPKKIINEYILNNQPKPHAKKPVAKKPPAKKPVAKKPPAKKPVAKKPPAKKPVAKKPVKRKFKGGGAAEFFE